MYAYRLFLCMYAAVYMQACRLSYACVPFFLSYVYCPTAHLKLSFAWPCGRSIFYAYHDHPPDDSEVTEILRQGFR